MDVARSFIATQQMVSYLGMRRRSLWMKFQNEGKLRPGAWQYYLYRMACRHALAARINDLHAFSAWIEFPCALQLVNQRSWSRNVLGWFIAFPSESSTRALGNRTPDSPINGPMGILLRDWGTLVQRLGYADKQSYVIRFARDDPRTAGCALVSLLLDSGTRLCLVMS